MELLQPGTLETAQPDPEPQWEWQVARLFPPRGEWTEDDYFALPDNRGVELSNGCLEFLPVPTEDHQFVIGFLYRHLFAFVEAGKLGWVLLAGIPVRLWEGKMREPDVVFLRREHRELRNKKKYWEGADLVMEVVSPEGRTRDLKEKWEEYAQAGIPEYWIIDPETECILVLVLDGEAYRTHGEFGRGTDAASVLLPGFSVSVDAVFDSAD